MFLNASRGTRCDIYFKFQKILWGVGAMLWEVFLIIMIMLLPHLMTTRGMAYLTR